MKKTNICIYGLIVALLVGMIVFPAKANASKIKFKAKSNIVLIGNSFTLKIKNNDGKITWKKTNRKIKLTRKNPHSVKVTGLKAGKATVVAKIGKKKYKYRVVVKKPIINSDIWCSAVVAGDPDDGIIDWYQLKIKNMSKHEVYVYVWGNAGDKYGYAEAAGGYVTDTNSFDESDADVVILKPGKSAFINFSIQQNVMLWKSFYYEFYFRYKGVYYRYTGKSKGNYYYKKSNKRFCEGLREESFVVAK